ncbi:MAG: DUF4168 domain-containing protein [Desulfosalsimonas sp.]
MMRCFKLASVISALCLALFIASAGIAAAGSDDVYENEIDEETELSKDDIEGEDMEAFLSAAEEVREIRAEYSEKISEAAEKDDADERYKELRQEAVDKMVEAISDAGLDEDTYRGIAYHLQEDEELMDRMNE